MWKPGLCFDVNRKQNGCKKNQRGASGPNPILMPWCQTTRFSTLQLVLHVMQLGPVSDSEGGWHIGNRGQSGGSGPVPRLVG